MATTAPVDLREWHQYSVSPKYRGSDPLNTGSTLDTASSLTQYGITWNFSSPVQYGQFFNGDYFVIGPVTVSSVTSSTETISGSQVNPVPSAGQGLASTGLDYEPTMAASFPLALSAGDSLVSATEIGSTTLNWAGRVIGSNPVIKDAAILTVLDTAPTSAAFRPCPCDTSNTLYYVSDVDDSILPDLSTTGITPPDSGIFNTPLEYFERGSARPWLLYGNDWQGRDICPANSMDDYHETIGFFLSSLLTYLMTDYARGNLVNQFVQIGIDYFHSGNAESSVWSPPVVVAGLLLGNTDMQNYWIDNPSARSQRDHEKFYYAADRTVSPSSSIVPAGESWVDWTNASGQHVFFGKQVGEEHEHLHPSEWTCYEPHCKSEVYRCQHDVYPIVGMMLSARIMDGQVAGDVLNMLQSDAAVDYADRWMSNIFDTGEYLSTGRTYREEMEFHTSFTIYNYNYGSGGSAFINDMWSTYR